MVVEETVLILKYEKVKYKGVIILVIPYSDDMHQQSHLHYYDLLPFLRYTKKFSQKKNTLNNFFMLISFIKIFPFQGNRQKWGRLGLIWI